jgi:preprotein translocase subunit SecD
MSRLVNLTAAMTDQTRKEITGLCGRRTSLRCVIELTGVSEPLVQRQGQNRIVELPGIQDTAGGRRLGKVANLNSLAANDAAAGDKQKIIRLPQR